MFLVSKTSLPVGQLWEYNQRKEMQSFSKRKALKKSKGTELNKKKFCGNAKKRHGFNKTKSLNAMKAYKKESSLGK